MRLIKPNDAIKPILTERTPLGREVFGQLCEVGDRLEHIVGRYGRLVMDIAGGQPLLDVRENVESLNLQLGYLAQRLQEVLVSQRDSARSGGSERDEAVVYRRAVRAG
jgi:hypothetical protein